ncbi:hypothetical protein SAMN05421780_101197 [Flexibacter flexilis DSM 6793]|uniref:Uncharacterized protein n=1 Tax=Flexibacter flexilis DSM 6793 TaxID=927664 RepID=A0A1I1DG39_9BACT|nr:hypothetical protein SAMN05421780_101197 [Flexibacter flexilis DSM 6793]
MLLRLSIKNVQFFFKTSLLRFRTIQRRSEHFFIFFISLFENLHFVVLGCHTKHNNCHCKFYGQTPPKNYKSNKKQHQTIQLSLKNEKK